MTPPTLERLHKDGWSLIPVRADKTALVSWKPYQETAPTMEQLTQWDETLRPAIWAGVTGEVSNRFGLDFDGPEGSRTLEKLGLEPHRLTVSGGYHADFLLPEWRVRTLAGKSTPALRAAYPGLDSRGEGGYINLIGSSGAGSYTWVSDSAPYSADVLPEDLRLLIGMAPTAGPMPTDESLASESMTDKAIASLVAAALHRVVGDGAGRNDTGFWLACQLRDNACDHDRAWEAMRLYAADVPDVDAHGCLSTYSEAEASASLEQAFAVPPREPSMQQSTLREIMVANRQLRDVSDDAVDALLGANDPPRLFHYGESFTRIVSAGAGRAMIETLNSGSLLHELSRAADWVSRPERWDDDGNYIPPEDVPPPPNVARDVLVRAPELELPILTGIREAPTLRPDGTVLSSKGFDTKTGLFVDVPPDLGMPAVSDHPTNDEVAEAVRLLRDELLGEYRYADSASPANALASVLTAVLRPAIPGLIPAALFDAPIAGSGKTLLADLMSIVATGRPANLTMAPNGNNEELRKQITALLLAGQELIVFDNLDGVLKSPVLAKALTGDVWTDRILGVSKSVRIPQHAVWVFTGNNITLGGDLGRRCYVVKLDPKMSKPWERAYRRSDLKEWASEHRGDLLWSCLTLARAWYSRGCPMPPGRPWGSFRGWQTMIGGILTVAGLDDFLGNLDDLQDHADPEQERWIDLLDFWLNISAGAPMRVQQMVGVLEAFAAEHVLPAEVAESLGSAPGAQAVNTRLGNKLRKVKGRRFDDRGLRIEQCGQDSHNKVVLWQVKCDPASGVDEEAEGTQPTVLEGGGQECWSS
jgi:hypothetical protein